MHLDLTLVEDSISAANSRLHSTTAPLVLMLKSYDTLA